MKNRFRKNQGKAGLKRPKTPDTSDINRGVKKNRVAKNKFNDNPPPTPSSSGESSEEEQLSGSASEHEKEEFFSYGESSAYDNLVERLKPSNNVDGNGSESMSDEGQGSDGEHAGSGDESELNDSLDEAGNTKYSYIKSDEESDGDDENDSDEDIEVNDQSANASSLATSSYNDHFGYNLADGATDNLEKRRLKYKWELPALGKSNCRWMGTGECFLKEAEMNSGCGLKPKLYDSWLDVYKKSGGTDFDMQRYFFCLFNSYWDILHNNKKPFYLKGQEEDSSVTDAYIMHSLNHVFRTSDLIRKNDAKIGKHLETEKGEILTGDGFLDHGFTRPKVLILLPIASIALRVVRRLIQLTPATHKVNIEHLDRFYDDFGTGVVEENVDDESSRNSSKPSDFQALFSGNNNDHFMIGIKFTRKSIKLYSDFYSSDFIIASPLGLITKIGEAEIEKERDVDYLSSIEVLIIDHADVISMQNWSHVNTVVDQLNRIPSKQHGTDVMRIRKWYLDGHARFYRQTILLGSYLNPDMNALFNHWCHNYKGKVKLSCEYKGVLPKVLLQVRQLYERFNPDSILEADDARLEYFAEKVYPKLKESNQGGTMLFISSYFEFVRVRNFLKAQNASFCLLGEYTKQSDISRARVWFFEGKRKIMLYTERAHFYHRYKIRGIQNLIMYSLPERKEFYPEIVNMLDGSDNMNGTVLFSRFDQLRLERIVGTSAAKRMVTSDKGVFVFC